MLIRKYLKHIRKQPNQTFPNINVILKKMHDYA